MKKITYNGQRRNEHFFIVIYCPASPERRRPSAASFRPRTHSDGPVSQTLLTSDFKRRELLRAFATLDDSTPQCRISELRVWSYEPFIVFASSSSGYTSGQNLEVLYILNNRNNQNIFKKLCASYQEIEAIAEQCFWKENPIARWLILRKNNARWLHTLEK